jgi:AcrR family transcriptional regulator
MEPRAGTVAVAGLEGKRVWSYKWKGSAVFSLRQVARILGIPERTVYHHAKTGGLSMHQLVHPVTGLPFWAMTPEQILEACRRYRLASAPVIDRMGDLLGWSDEKKFLCALEFEGFTREDLEEFWETGEAPWDRVVARVQKEGGEQNANSAWICRCLSRSNPGG